MPQVSNSTVEGSGLRTEALAIVGTRPYKCVDVKLTAVDSAGGVFAFLNPEGRNIIIDRIVLDVTTQSAGACTVSIGAAATAGTLSATAMSGQSVAAAGQLPSTLAAKVTSAQFITGSVATGASSGLVGRAYIYYFPCD